MLKIGHFSRISDFLAKILFYAWQVTIKTLYIDHIIKKQFALDLIISQTHIFGFGAILLNFLITPPKPSHKLILGPFFSNFQLRPWSQLYERGVSVVVVQCDSLQTPLMKYEHHITCRVGVSWEKCHPGIFGFDYDSMSR